MHYCLFPRWCSMPARVTDGWWQRGFPVTESFQYQKKPTGFWSPLFHMVWIISNHKDFGIFFRQRWKYGYCRSIPPTSKPGKENHEPGNIEYLFWKKGIIFFNWKKSTKCSLKYRYSNHKKISQIRITRPSFLFRQRYIAAPGSCNPNTPGQIPSASVSPRRGLWNGG